MIAGEELKGRLSQAVVSAGQRYYAMLETQFAGLGNHLLGEAGRKSRIVARVEKQWLLAEPRITLDVAGRADHHPDVTQLLQRDGGLQPLTDMLARQPFPNHIGKIRGAVREDIHLEARVVNAG